MRRARVFAAPFVVTAALSGCEDHSRSKEPKPTPRTQPDAQMIIGNPPTPVPDAMMSHNPPMPMPDAAPLAEAPKGATTVAGFRGCYLFGDPSQVVRCPDAGATFTLADPAHFPGGLSVDEWNLRCRQSVQPDCPPPGPLSHTCNPPSPREVDCPADMLPTLRVDLEPIRKDGRCSWHVDGADDVFVACPPDLILPDKLAVELGSGRITLDPTSMKCLREEAFECPDPGPGKAASCNPPAPEPIECPEELLPHVRGGLKVKKHDGKCWHGDVQVGCP